MMEIPVLNSTTLNWVKYLTATDSTSLQPYWLQSFTSPSVEVDRRFFREGFQDQLNQKKKEEKPMPEKPKRRIVQVFIADTDENVPMEQALLYRGEQKLTDSTDQELFFEIPINDLLGTHNSNRSKLLNKKATEKSGKDVFLEPIRIRDLVMTVVQIASF